MNYSERIVCFLDILGFADHIRGTIYPNGSDNVDRISEIVEALALAREILDIDHQPVFSPKRVTQFSDSIVISFPVDKQSGLFHALAQILWLQMNFLNKGMLCRGAIASGRLMHDADVLFGPAMVDAYTLESKAANYPRVILDQRIIDQGVAAHSDHHDAEDEQEGIMSFLTKDGDGMFYVDYIGKAIGEFDHPEEYPVYLSKLREIIFNGIKSKDPSIRVKYSWLREKFNGCLTQIRTNIANGNDGLQQAYMAIETV